MKTNAITLAFLMAATQEGGASVEAVSVREVATLRDDDEVDSADDESAEDAETESELEEEEDDEESSAAEDGPVEASLEDLGEGSNTTGFEWSNNMNGMFGGNGMSEQQ